MSDLEVPESTSFRQLELLVRHLGEELAGFRRRAIGAESRVRALESELERNDASEPAGATELAALTAENAELRARLTWASDRTRQVLTRVRFLRQQQTRAVATAPTGARQ